MYNTLIILSRFISKATTVPIMESEVPSLMPKSLRYWKKIYYCYVPIYVKAFQPFQRRINSTKTIINLTTCSPSHKRSYATSSYFVAVEYGQLTLCNYDIS